MLLTFQQMSPCSSILLALADFSFMRLARLVSTLAWIYRFLLPTH